jgi:hypothetical protein
MTMLGESRTQRGWYYVAIIDAAQVTRDRNLAPPNWSMVFPANQQGGPWVAKWVQFLA